MLSCFQMAEMMSLPTWHLSSHRATARSWMSNGPRGRGDWVLCSFDLHLRHLISECPRTRKVATGTSAMHIILGYSGRPFILHIKLISHQLNIPSFSGLRCPSSTSTKSIRPSRQHLRTIIQASQNGQRYRIQRYGDPVQRVRQPTLASSARPQRSPPTTTSQPPTKPDPKTNTHPTAKAPIPFPSTRMTPTSPT